MLLCTWVVLAGIGHFAAGSSRFPDSFRVEVELIKFENQGSVDYQNQYCDVTSQCDTTISAYIDLETSLKPHTPHWQYNKVFEVTNTDSPTINKPISKDVCGGGLYTATLRALVYDADLNYQRATIDELDCRFPMNASAIAESEATATYGESILCKARYRDGDHKLYARVRAYKTSDTYCILSGKVNSTIPLDWIQQANGVSHQAEDFRPDQAMRIEFEPVTLQNPSGVTYTGEPCEANNETCQPLFMAKLDTDNAMSAAAWNDNSRLGELAKYSGINSPKLGSDVMHDVCGGELDWINLRVIVKHAPTWHERKLQWHEYRTIEEFDCPTRFIYSLAGTSHTAAWGPTRDCFSRHPSGMKMEYRIRAYPISINQCSIYDRLGQEAVREQATYTQQFPVHA